MNKSDAASVDRILSGCPQGQKSLIEVLQDIQQANGYLSREALGRVSARLGIPLSKLFALATFYNAFSLEPQGRHVISVCLGTACHVKKGDSLAQMLARKLGLKENRETTDDGMFTLKKVRCLGCCSMAPVIKLDGTIRGGLNQKNAEYIIDQCRKNPKP
jgi:NADH-quinone oxidoreductase subunit E